jgi:hypothetical protein
MKSIKFFFSLFLISLLFLQFNGCTALGLYAGLRRDARQLKEFNQTTFELHNLNPGTSMYVMLANGDTISGEFLRLDTMVVDDYAALYEKTRQSVLSEIRLPQLYDSISINQNRFYRTNFLGFDYGCIKLKKRKDNSCTRMNLNDIIFICKSENNCIKNEELRKIIARGEFPLLSDLVLSRENTEVKIPAEKLVQGKITEKYYGWLTGVSVGLAADALFVIFVVIPNTDFAGQHWDSFSWGY